MCNLDMFSTAMSGLSPKLDVKMFAGVTPEAILRECISQMASDEKDEVPADRL